MIIGAVKSLNLPIEYVLYELSYANLSLYTSSLPTYSPKKKDDESGTRRQDYFKADDPKNRDKLRAFFDSVKD